MRGPVLLIAASLALTNCAADVEHATPSEQPDEIDGDTVLAALRAREVAHDVAAIVERMRRPGAL